MTAATTASSTLTAIAMSGGVDSSVAAILESRSGATCFGLFMNNWEDEGCSAAEDFGDVASVCEKIGIPFHEINFSKTYWENVFQDFLTDYERGFTPNPDVACNREIKFKVLLEHALKLGASRLATGHYARIGRDEEGRATLMRAKDASKDQSYFLHQIPSTTLERITFPLGDLLKTQVRSLAKEKKLITATKKDSTGICFIGERKFREFLAGYLKPKEGSFIDVDSAKPVGTHPGAHFFTYGQRQGLGLGGQGEPWFVVDKDVASNTVFVGRGHYHPALYRDSLSCESLYFVDGLGPKAFPFACTAKLRYRQEDQACVILKIENGKALVAFPTPQRAPTLGQSIVFYQGDRCLGGGTIASLSPSYFEMKKKLPQIALASSKEDSPV